jgi:hypothetical protein
MRRECHKTGRNNILQNSGGPRSRVRCEPVSSDLLESTGTGRNVMLCIVTVPPETEDCFEWLDGLSRRAGFKGIRDADEKIARPDRSLCVAVVTGLYPVNRRLESAEALADLLLHALILARCNSTSYNSDAVPVFTRSRLDRYIELFIFNMETFYEMD